MHLNDAVRDDINRSVLCWLATVDADGFPTVSPKEMFCAYGSDRLIIADIASRGSIRNLNTYNKVCVSFVDVFRQKGFKVKGVAKVIPLGDPGFQEIAYPLLEKAGPDYPIRNIICVQVEKVQRIWAPSYNLFPDKGEEQLMREAYTLYGVRPLTEDDGS
ncbi:pyridoxamine 5'-phosphate oxidase family protein [Pseudovibrio exalbescens]|uniref:pyridoxamine 5'-phosphate oxidase family protein n=1 Tax=Pseudovibrio exalbescens TaxID=197461 RepID=UPI0023658471|nr:pyridoxamine 5'-phosphate oxidase family protein [Pseudovibrio exalbescens]MDD7911003.1 pyridoxamine 5'-phosphate oxidase family protein [Pseudovibrio exalbescens]